MMLRNLLIVSALTISLLSCSTGRVSVFTNPPEAEVYAKPIGSNRSELLGKTPFSIDSTAFKNKYGTGGAIQLTLKKDGFKEDNFYITEISRIDLSINRDLEPERDRVSQDWLNKSVTKMFEVRRLVEARRYGEALSQIREVKKQLPLVSAVHELEGGILLLKGDYRSSLDAYRVAIKLNQENTEAAKMVRYLERTYGFPKETDIADYDQALPPTDRKPSQVSEGKE